MGSRTRTLEFQRVFDLSGSTLTKMRGRLSDFKRILWWSGQPQDSKTPNDDRNAFIKIVFGSDTELNSIESVIGKCHAMFDAVMFRNVHVK
jgi:hypothetical protein